MFYPQTLTYNWSNNIIYHNELCSLGDFSESQHKIFENINKHSGHD